MNSLIIEMRGGVVQEIYSDTKNLRVVLVDWTDDDPPCEPFGGGNFATQPIASLPEETIRAVLSLSA